jgi:hypothetical protein
VTTPPRTGLFIIRAWIEPGSSSPLRAQIRLTSDVSQGFEQDLNLALEEAVVAAVRAWLAELLAGPTLKDDPDALSSL